MSDKQSRQIREERLAAQLRANLRRRKEQARALREGAAPPATLPKPDSPR